MHEASNSNGKNDRDSDATSSETLDDLEEREQVADSDSPADDELPSPDGALDERDEIEDAGPM
ncbi:MAG TPA: hypothetical protein VGO68_07120 [Pyrinomonadaceae bacterium]|jgi:hypothetical protein|nr:hypothetical protein [Pyrinomonadaceae bacterium]